MASSLFGKPNPPQMMNNLMPQQVQQIMSVLKNKNPNALLQQMAAQDPQINAFLQMHKGKSPQQIAKECGVDYNFLMSLINK